MQQMRRFHRGQQIIRCRFAQQIGDVNFRAAQLLRDFAICRSGKHCMNFASLGQQRRDAPAADESAGSGYEHALSLHQDKDESRAEITVGADGHSIANAGSFQRNPRPDCGAYAAEIM